MDDFILVVIFLIFSLVSFIKKLRESKHEMGPEPVKGDIEERESTETLFGPEIKSATEESTFPATIPKAQTRPRTPIEVERSLTPLSSASPVSLSDEPMAVTLKASEKASQFEKETLTRSPLNVTDFDNLQRFSKQSYSLLTTRPKKKSTNISVDLRSKLSLRKAILVREIFDRPRAYDI